MKLVIAFTLASALSTAAYAAGHQVIMMYFDDF